MRGGTAGDRGWGGHTLSGGGYPQGRLTRRTRQRPRWPRAPPRPGAARLPSSRGLGPRRGGSAISERTLCRSRAQPPLPPGGGGGALPLAAPAQVPAESGPRSRTAEVPGSRTVLRSALSSLGLGDAGLRAPPAEAHPPPVPARWHSLASVGRRDSRGRGGPRLRAGPLKPGGGGGRVGPLRGEGGGAALDAGGARGRGETPGPPATGRQLSSPPRTRLCSPVGWLEADEFMRKFSSKMSPKGVGEATSLHLKLCNSGG